MKTFSSACNKEQTSESQEMKFRKNLRSFLTFNLIIFIFMIIGLGGSWLWKVSIIWGAILAIKGRHYLKQDKQPVNEQRQSEPSREQYGRPRRPEWRDKDLV